MKVVISGYGKMGHIVEEVLREKGIEVALATEDVRAVPPALAAECVCIDFTTPDAFRANYPFIAERFKAAVIGTTGWDDLLDAVCLTFENRRTPMIYTSNFSVGVNAFFAAVVRTCQVLKGIGYVPAIEEIHHIHKLDAPSGTAKTLAGLVEKVLGVRPEITSRREGEVPGTHTVEFRCGCDRLVFTHEAFSRRGFAEGAVLAAQMTEKLEGAHNFLDLIL
ncbi:MAG: 4-hydroxy-tetrahydrodipicolinate reductase [Bacteroidales bacterium]|nr:4-hydroxy-tetrahydrodipicolinate reductase [Bacteroidales bacterium]